MRSMRHVVASALVLAALPLVAGLGGCAEGGRLRAGPTMPPQALPDMGRVGLRTAWQRVMPMGANERVADAWRVGDSLYITTNTGRLGRIDAKSGVLTFDKALGAENLEIYRPIDLKPAKEGGFGEVLVTTRAGAIVFNQETGDVVRQGDFGISPSCSPVLVGNVLCIGGAGRFYGFYLDRLNNRRWVKDAPGDLFDSTPVVVGNTDIIFASKNGELSRIDTDDGDWKWKDRKTNGQVVAGLAADGRAVYVPSLDQRLYAFSAEKGAELWQAQLQGTLDQTPALGGNVVLCPARGPGLFAINRQNGQQAWLAAGVTSVATVSGDHVWVGDNQGNLKSLSLATGDVLAEVQIPGAMTFIRNEVDDAVYVINRSGTVGAFVPR